MVERYYINAEAIISFDMWVLQDPGKQEWSKHTYKYLISRNEVRGDKFYSVGVTGTNEIVLFPVYVCDPFLCLLLQSRETRKFKHAFFFLCILEMPWRYRIRVYSNK